MQVILGMLFIVPVRFPQSTDEQGTFFLLSLHACITVLHTGSEGIISLYSHSLQVHPEGETRSIAILKLPQFYFNFAFPIQLLNYQDPNSTLRVHLYRGKPR